jgi:hypothetical protein
MPKVSRLLPGGLEQLARHDFTAQHIGLELGERRAVQVRVGVGVVAELESGIEPGLQERHALRVRLSARLGGEFHLVDEADRRNLVPHQSVEQVPRHFLPVPQVAAEHVGREVIDRDGNAPLRRFLRPPGRARDHTEGQHEGGYREANRSGKHQWRLCEGCVFDRKSYPANAQLQCPAALAV